MKTLLLLFLAGATACVTLAADGPSMEGKWDIHTSISGNESDMACTLTQKEGSIGGSCSTQRGAVEITGKVDGNKVAWSYKSDYNGTPLTVKYSALVSSPKEIKGRVEVPEFGVAGDFVATSK